MGDIQIHLQKGGIELAGDASGSGDLVLPGAVAQQFASVSIGQHLLACEEAQAHDKRPFHLCMQSQSNPRQRLLHASRSVSTHWYAREVVSHPQ